MTNARNFWEYVDFIYLNTILTRDDARKIAIDYWNHDVDKNKAVVCINEEDKIIERS